MGSLAAQAAAALANARVCRHADRLAALNRLTRAMTSVHDSPEACGAIAEAATTLLGAVWTRVWADDPAERVVRAQATFGVDPEIDDLMSELSAFPYGEGLVGRIAENHAPEYVRDIVHEPRWLNQRLAATGRVHGFAGLPLITGHRMVGVLTILFREPRDFGADDKQLIALLADHAAIALDNARSYEDAREQLRTTTALLAVAQALSDRAPVEEMMRRVGREVARAIGADTVGAYFLDAQKEALLPIAGYRLPKDLLETFRRMPLVLARWPAIRDAMRDQRVIWSGDSHGDPRFDPQTVGPFPPHSILFAPTVARGEAVGGIYIAWWQAGREFLPGEIRLIEGVATQVGLALENVDLTRQTEAKLEETETLLAVSRALSSTLDISMLMRHFLRRIATVLNADGVGSYMLADDGEWLVPLQGYRLPPDYLQALRQLRLSIVQHPFYAEGARTNRPVFSPDVMSDPRIPDIVRHTAPHTSELFVPILAKGQVIGGLVAVWWQRVREFSENELALIEAIASQAGVALENARLFQENRRQVKELSALHALSRAVTGELDRRTLIAALQGQVTRVFEARDLLVLLRGQADDEVVVALSVRDATQDGAPFRRAPADRAGLAGAVLESGLPVRTDDYAGECARRRIDPGPSPASLPHWLGVPMTAGDSILGVVALASAEHAFTEADERLLTNIAQLAALALRSARLFEERETAYSELAAAQDQLVRTEKLRALGEMASGVAHDFNNVLAAILGRAQLLMGNLRDPRLREWVQIIDRVAQDGAQTVRRLQEFTRIRRDQPVVAVDLNDVVRGALEMTESRWRDEPARQGAVIELRTSLPPVPPIAGDPAELREAMTNLILNAVDAMPGGGVLELTTAAAGDSVEVTVSDTGVGMPESVRAKIFDPFFTTKGARGTGLGLSMTYGILVRHDAQITVESEPGRGSTFRLSFPRTTDAEFLAEAAPAKPEPASVVPLRCLVIDDDQWVAAVLRDVLTSAGHTVLVYTDPAAAIARAHVDRFDLVFTDLAMPGMAGWQVARAVKSVDPNTAVLLMTGYGVELSPEEREGRGVDLVLTKPVGVDAILQAVARVVSRTADN
jgi:GAF domain-containing protein